jgi:hypothetical protein
LYYRSIVFEIVQLRSRGIVVVGAQQLVAVVGRDKVVDCSVGFVFQFYLTGCIVMCMVLGQEPDEIKRLRPERPYRKEPEPNGGLVEYV